jgi:hypothetical protein
VWNLDGRILAHGRDAAALNDDRALLDGVAAKTVDHACTDDRCGLVIDCHVLNPDRVTFSAQLADLLIMES